MTIENRVARRGFTLVELLVVITILSLMSGMFLVAYRGAAEESNIQKSRSTIQKISEVLNARMDEYSNYAVALRVISTGGSIPSNVGPVAGANASTAVLRERARLLALRDIIRMEMPDHPDDIKCTTFWAGSRNSAQFKTFLETSLNQPIPTGLGNLALGSISVRNTLTSRTRALMTRVSAGGLPLSEWDKVNANAELLFLIVEGSDFNGSNAIELFGKSEIGDTDGDGLNEFIDAYGRPIRWIRWPAGFSGASRFYPDMLDPALVSGGRLLVNSEAYDRLGSDPGWGSSLPPGTGLTPLVVSPGGDGGFGLRFREFDRYGTGTAPPAVGTFDGRPSYSSADAPWTGVGSSYGLRNFTDPWFPRDPSSNLRIRMGEVITNLDLPEPGFSSPIPSHASDNLTNYDGTAVSL